MGLALKSNKLDLSLISHNLFLSPLSTMKEFTIRIPQQLGPIIRGFRKERGLTQETIGSRAGIPQNDISSIELNPGSVSFERLARLLAALELELVIRPRQKANKEAW
jgi:HTH-type transcriptional regulator/antitoxin HipB